MAAIAERGNDSMALPDHCDFYVDREKGRQLDAKADAFGMTVAFINGSLSWFEPVPPTVQSNTPTVAMVDLQLYDDGPAGKAPTVPHAIGVSLPVPADLAGEVVRGQLNALTNASLWSDHVLVYNLHAYDGTGVLQVVFPASNASGRGGGRAVDVEVSAAFHLGVTHCPAGTCLTAAATGLDGGGGRAAGEVAPGRRVPLQGGRAAQALARPGRLDRRARALQA